jgi:hypothetical protein
MGHFDLFGFFRFMLAVLVTAYGMIRLIFLIWRWQGISGRVRMGSPVLYRYVIVLLLRARLRRFAYELSVIGGLVVVLVLLIRLHW